MGFQLAETPNMRSARLVSTIPALWAALLFGAAAPSCKILLGGAAPLPLAALLYLGSGAGLTVWMFGRRFTRGRKEVGLRLRGRDGLTLCGAVLSGGVLAPMLFLAGLSRTPASTVSLLLNLELVFTALLAWLGRVNTIGLIRGMMPIWKSRASSSTELRATFQSSAAM